MSEVSFNILHFKYPYQKLSVIRESIKNTVNKNARLFVTSFNHASCQRLTVRCYANVDLRNGKG
jgi:hypothetical protein